jgi:hypothetical protein
MQNVLIPAESLIDFDDEPRLLDTELASHLEFKRSYDIRELINRNRDELGMYGPLVAHALVKESGQGGVIARLVRRVILIAPGAGVISLQKEFPAVGFIDDGIGQPVAV